MALESRTLGDFRDDAAVWVSRAMNNGWARPDWVSVNLTLKCNLACSFCQNWVSSQTLKDDQAVAMPTPQRPSLSAPRAGP